MIRRRRNTDRRMFLLGLATLVVLLGFAYISYTANKGLPLEGHRTISVDVPSANRLIPTSDVRIGGVRVGQVTKIEPEVGGTFDGPYARLTISVKPSADPLPVDTVARVRPASVLGATYLDLELGRSTRAVPDHGTIKAASRESGVELTDLLDVFDQATARHIQETIHESSNALVGRGTSLNTILGALAPLLPPLQRTMAVLADPVTNLRGAMRGFARTTAAVADRRSALAGIMSGGARTFGALAREHVALGETIDGLPPAEASLTTALRRVSPALDGLAALTVQLRPAAAILPSSLHEVDTTLAAGLRPLRELPAFAGPLRQALAAIRGLGQAPEVDGALREVSTLLRTATPTTKVVGAAQIHCNVISQWSRGLSSVFGDLGVGHGPALGSLVVNQVGTFLEPLQNAAPGKGLGVNLDARNNAQECESGNEPYDGETHLTNPAGSQSTPVFLDTAPPPGALDLARRAGLLRGAR